MTTDRETRVLTAARVVDQAETCCEMALFALDQHAETCPRMELRVAILDLDAPVTNGWSDAEIADRKAQGFGGGAPHAEVEA